MYYDPEDYFPGYNNVDQYSTKFTDARDFNDLVRRMARDVSWRRKHRFAPDIFEFEHRDIAQLLMDQAEDLADDMYAQHVGGLMNEELKTLARLTVVAAAVELLQLDIMLHLRGEEGLLPRSTPRYRKQRRAFQASWQQLGSALRCTRTPAKRRFEKARRLRELLNA